MTGQQRRSLLGRSARALQDNISRSGAAASAGYTMTGALALLGGLGYAFDRWQGTSPWGLLAGLVLGMIVGFYELIRTTRPR